LYEEKMTEIDDKGSDGGLPLVWHSQMLPSIEKRFGWKSEYDRLCRWWMRLAGTDEDDADIETAIDFYLAFFQSAFIMQEWLKYQFPDEHAALIRMCPFHGIVRDIAIRHRHLTIERPSNDAAFVICREYAVYRNNESQLILLSGGQKYELFDIARRIFTHWNNMYELGYMKEPPLIAAGGR
jgi:hypothetical protein